MGTNFVDYSVKSMSWEDLKKYHKRHCQDALERGGHGEGASGNMSNNTFLVDQGIAFDQEEAWSLINKVADKWDENSYAIKLYDTPTTWKKRQVSLKNQRDKIHLRLRDMERNRLESIRGSKSKRKTCNKCNSMIATSYIHKDSCPVCGDTFFIYTESQVEKIHQLIKKRGEINNKLNEPIPKPTNTSGLKWKWFVGAQCPT